MPAQARHPRERNKNSFNLIGVAGDQMVITHYLYVDKEGGFVPVGTHAFPRETGSLGEKEEP